MNHHWLNITPLFRLEDELNSIWRVQPPEEVKGLSVDDSIEKIAEMVIPTEEDYGSLYGTDRDSLKDAVLWELDAVQLLDGAEDPHIRLTRLLEDVI